MIQFIIKHVEVKTLLNYSVGESYTVKILPCTFGCKNHPVQILKIMKISCGQFEAYFTWTIFFNNDSEPILKTNKCFNVKEIFTKNTA